MTEVTVLGTIEVVGVTVVMLVDTVEAIDNTTDNTAYCMYYWLRGGSGN